MRYVEVKQDVPGWFSEKIRIEMVGAAATPAILVAGNALQAQAVIDLSAAAGLIAQSNRSDNIPCIFIVTPLCQRQQITAKISKLRSQLTIIAFTAHCFGTPLWPHGPALEKPELSPPSNDVTAHSLTNVSC